MRIRLLGGFEVDVGGRAVGAEAWPTRRAAELVQLLALADRHRMLRDEAIDALWPQLDGDAGAANLRKAAHHARRALGCEDAVALRGGSVLLFPQRPIDTDAARFERLAAEALESREPALLARAAAAWTGDLLPDARYEAWADPPRQRLRERVLSVLRAARQWERLADIEPTDEEACRELMRAALNVGSRATAVRWYGRLRAALERELGQAPAPSTQALYAQCIAGSQAPVPRFIGRDSELAVIDAMLRAPADAGVAAVALRGPAGIGKSALCRHALALAQRSGKFAVGVETADESRPYTLAVTVVERLAAARPGLLDGIGAHARFVLSALGTDVATLRGGPTQRLPLGRHEVVGALRRVLLAAAGTNAPLLLVDDAHRLDASSADVLLHLAASGGPVRLLLAMRAGGSVLDRGLARLAGAGTLALVDVGPMPAADTASLVAATAEEPLAAPLVDQIVAAAGGNPFAAIELARHARSGRLPTHARDALIARLCDVGDSALSLLERLALAADRFDTATALAFADVDEPAVFDALDRALDAAVLEAVDGRYRFRHEIVRQTLLERVSPHRRLGLHRHAAARLTGLEAAPSVIAQHWLAGGEPSQALPHLRAAARDALAVGGYVDALRHLDALLAHAPQDPEALAMRAEALDAVGDPRALAAYDAAAAVDAAGRDDLRAKRALAQLKAGDAPGALAAIAGAAPRTVSGRLAEALTYSGAAALGFGDARVGSAKAAECRRLAIESGDQASIVIASWAQAAAAHARGELHASVWADLRDTRDLPQLAVRVFDGHLCITQRFLYGARPYPEVIAFADSLAADAHRMQAARGQAFAVTLRGEAKLLSGRLDEAEEDLIEGGRLHRRIGGATGEALALQRRAELALYRGRVDESQALLDDALDLARQTDIGFHLLDRIYGTRIAAARDRPERALSALQDAESAVRGPLETCPGCRITFAVPAVIAAARAGDLERAQGHERAAEYLANVVMRLPAWNAALEEARGYLAAARGEMPESRRRFSVAAEGFARAGHPLDAKRCAASARAPR